MSRVLDLEITCPECGTVFQASGHTVIDSADEADAEAFWALKEGSINIAHCPKCSASGFIPVPLVLHESEREMVLAFVPNAEEMSEETIGSMIGPILEGFLSSVPEEKQADYMFEPIVTDDPMALVMAARGESLEDYEYDEEDDDEDDEEEEELTEEEMREIQARQALLQDLLQVPVADSLSRITMLRNNQTIVDDMLVQLIGIVTEQARAIQPDALQSLNKIMNEIEVFMASN
jgi:hypothetical protein